MQRFKSPQSPVLIYYPVVPAFVGTTSHSDIIGLEASGGYETMWIQGYPVVSGEDKTHGSGLKLSNHDFFEPNKPWDPLLPSHA